MALTNADFRSFIKGGNSNELGEFSFEKKRKPEKKPSENDQKREKRKLHYIQIQKKKNEKEKKFEEDQELAKYRDRAQDRRQCKDDFYKQVADEYREMNDRSIEESKYLGGDYEHTHLVKGLDFALLSKVRSELEDKKKEAELQSLKMRQENKKKNTVSIRTVSGKRLHKLLFQDLHPHHLLFRDKLKQMDSIILKGLKFRGNSDSFLPGRTCYLFDTRMEMIDDEIPTIIFNSLQDCPKNNEGFVYSSSPHIIQAMSEAMKWHHANRKKRKQDRLPRRPGSSTHKLAVITESTPLENAKPTDTTHQNNDDDNIYAGIDDYNPDEMINNSTEILRHSSKNEISDLVQTPGHNIPNIDDDFNSRYRMDIIRDEQGMEVDDDTSQNQGYQSSFYPIPAGIDPNSSMAAVYTMNDYGEYQFDYRNQEYFGDSYHHHLDKNAIPYVASESGKAQKSGMTTTDQDKGLHSVYKRDEDALRKRGDEDEREKDPAYVSDTYMECYPGFGGDVAYEAYDSDDNEDRSKMDMGRLKQYGAKRRDDFKRREDWEQYQLEKEALPKAAFQYGRKMDDNRVTRRKKKLNADEEWKKLKKMMGDKDKGDRLESIKSKLSAESSF